MYNRYVPQPDGSYQRNRMQDPPRPAPPPVHQPAPAYAGPQEPSDPPQRGHSGRSPQRRREPPAPARSFLRQLLPGNLDTEDLLVVVLLLLMAGDCEEDRNSALLTLALYLFL